MTIPKVPPGAAKLFAKKRSRRQIVSDAPATNEIDKAVPSGTIEVPGLPAVVPVVAVEAVPPQIAGAPPGFRRR